VCGAESSATSPQAPTAPSWLRPSTPPGPCSSSDPDGDTLRYAWSATCAGSWNNTSSPSAQFTPSRLPAGACNNCRLTVSVSDGRGGQTTGTVALCVSETPPPYPSEPVIIRSYRSSDTATPSQVLTYEVVASDPQGSALSFSWDATAGSLGTPDSDDSRSRITWTAPLCVSTRALPSITVTVMNPLHPELTATRSFEVTGLPSCPVPTGYWASTGSMAQHRTAHAAALLPNGKVLVSGGKIDEADPFEPYFKSAEVYDPATGTWSATGSMAEGRSEHTATLLPNGKVLVAGGNGLLAAELYDPATGTWSPTGSMAATHSEHTATLLPNGKVLVAGELGSPEGPWDIAELYDPTLGTWSLTDNMITFRENHTATLLPNGKVLAVGGQILDGNYELASAELYTP
jgi:Kelch motif